MPGVSRISIARRRIFGYASRMDEKMEAAISLRLPVELLRRIDQWCGSQPIGRPSRQDLIRYVVGQFLDGQEAPKPPRRKPKS